MSEETTEQPIMLADFHGGGTGAAAELDMSLVNKELLESDIIKEKAREIWETGNVLEFMCESVAKFHADDLNIIKALFLSYASVFVKNCHGVNIEITGSAGSGKTHVVKVVLLHIPPNSKLKAKLSDKALYYYDLSEGTIIAYDDQDLSEDMQSTVKNLSWDEETELITVKQQTKLCLSIPPRCPYWNTKVEGSGDEQIQDRVIKFWADESAAHKKRRDDMENMYLIDPGLICDGEYSAKVSQEIWSIIRGLDKIKVNKYVVSIPFANRIIGGNGDARNRNLFIALIQASCILNLKKREFNADGGYYVATEEDFSVAEAIINPLMRNEGGSQGAKLNRNAMKVLDVLKEKSSDTYAYEFLMRWCHLTKAQLSHAINGRRADGLDGLVAKCPAVNTTNLTTSKQSGYTKDIETGVPGESWTRLTSSRFGVIWNKEFYEKWCKESSSQFFLQTDDEIDAVHEQRRIDPDEEEYLYQNHLHSIGADDE